MRQSVERVRPGATGPPLVGWDHTDMLRLGQRALLRCNVPGCGEEEKVPSGAGENTEEGGCARPCRQRPVRVASAMPSRKPLVVDSEVEVGVGVDGQDAGSGSEASGSERPPRAASSQDPPHPGSLPLPTSVGCLDAAVRFASRWGCQLKICFCGVCGGMTVTGESRPRR